MRMKKLTANDPETCSTDFVAENLEHLPEYRSPIAGKSVRSIATGALITCLDEILSVIIIGVGELIPALYSPLLCFSV